MGAIVRLEADFGADFAAGQQHPSRHRLHSACSGPHRIADVRMSPRLHLIPPTGSPSPPHGQFAAGAIRVSAVSNLTAG